MGIPVFKVHAFYVDGLLIDTGFVRCREGFLKVCDALPGIQTLVNTHHHEDHTGNNFWITKRYGIIPMAHPRASAYLRSPSRWIKFYRRRVWGVPPPSNMSIVGSEIETKHFCFRVIPTPGHSDDHLCLYEPNEGWLFSGDLFLDAEVRYAREDENLEELLASLRKVATLAPRRMYCSFSGLIKKPREALQEKIDFLEGIREGVEEGVKQGLSPQEIQRRLLGPGDRFRFVTAGQISKKNTIQAFLKRKGVER